MRKVCGALLVGLLVCAGSILGEAKSAKAPPSGELPAGFFAGLSFRHVGPIGNRVAAVVGVPGEAGTYYAGAASGGIWKTTDGGVTWVPVFDEQGVASIGALAVAPSDSNVVWAGTGEAFLRSNVSIGSGVYRSTDAGRTWKHAGLPNTGRIPRIVVHPKDPDTAWVAALGHCWGPQPERGVFKTTDGGKTWRQVLFVDQETGVSDLVVDPTNPRILFAGSWQIRMWTAGRESGGPGSGLHVSRDGGETWQRLEGKGLPKAPWGKVALAMTPADPRRVYALIEVSSNRDFAPVDPADGVLWRSDDGGTSWKLVNADHTLTQRPLYYSRAAASPDDADEIRFMAVEHSLSIDGGKTTTEVESGWDHHDVWIDPTDADRIILGYDGGVSISTNRGKTWLRPHLPIAQMYHVAVDDQIPYFVYGNRQDGSSFRGPSNSLTGSSLPIGVWQTVGGCESGFAIPRPDGSVVYSGCYDGILERWDAARNQSQNVMVWPEAIESHAAQDIEHRFQWTFPVAMSPHDPTRVWAGSQYVHQTTDGGVTWTRISPDLTKNEPGKQRRTGGLTLDDASPSVAPALFALAESPLTPGEIWAGTNDGQVQLTRDAGATWTNLTAALLGLPPDGTVSNVEPSRHAAGTAYLTVDRHQLADFRSYVYKTTDWGKTWRKVVAGVPQDHHAYAHVVREDPARPGLLYLGTENALYLSFDDGERWQRLAAGLPPAPVHWIEVQPRFGDLVVATYGRGLWILDDLSVLRQPAAPALAGTHLFAPRAAWRFRRREEIVAAHVDPAAGRNPAYGALIQYSLPAEPSEGEKLWLEIVDGTGQTVRKLEEVPKKAGLNRAVWDLRGERTTEPKLRTQPDEHPHESFDKEGARELSDGGRFAVLVPPGTYTVRLHRGDEVQSQPLEVLIDPVAAGGEQAIARQTEALASLHRATNQVVAIINEIEWLRRQLQDLVARLGAADKWPEVAKEAGTLEEKLKTLEGELFDLRLTGAGQDMLRWPRKLYGRLTYLADYVDKTDHAPTASQLALLVRLEGEVAKVVERMDALRAGPVAEFNRKLPGQGFPYVVPEGKGE